jgi:indolepyruvate ferredoxin oxidoreductase
MNAPTDPKHLVDISLDDKYSKFEGLAFMTGTQALVRLPMLQRQKDLAQGKNTAGYISGYRGSPLGGFDQALVKAQSFLDEHHVKFQPGVNEDLAATAIWGTQQVNMFAGAKYDGVFGIWYGKGPGVDRCGDVFKHANMAGTAPLGGVIALAGDDHGAKSSTTAHQSEQILQAVSTPVFYPASVQDILDFGLHAWALSRFAGLWVGMKCVTDIVESGATVSLDPNRVQPVIPHDALMPAGGLSIRLSEHNFLAEEDRLLNYKLPAVQAYLRVNAINRVEWAPQRARVGLVSAGKAYRDLRQGLADLGIDESLAEQHGLRLYKLGCTWPLEETGVLEFANGLDEILVIEEKRSFIESQMKEILFRDAQQGRAVPRVIGKHDEHGNLALPLNGELTPALVSRFLAARLLPLLHDEAGRALHDQILARLDYLDRKEGGLAKSGIIAIRQPYFCSGCPHNSSTKVPEGSRALAGIGCHYMAQWMDRSTATFTHMGAEGMTWAGHAPFTNEKHVFVNLGDGTYFHSGLLAVRAAVASGVNATYKILFNDAVAMTGGQRHDGNLSPVTISQQLYGEGVKPVIVVTDEPEKYPAGLAWAPGVTIRHRDELDAVQTELRELPGISAIIYDQTCASEKRRRRKRNEFPDPARRAFINDAVCEGCGDCSVASNCISIEPLDTELGRKRKINQSSCNKDFSCVNGFCPSFVTVEGGQLRRPTSKKSAQAEAPLFPSFAEPTLASSAKPYGILVAGIGGTGVITIGQIIAVAAHLEGRAASVLDMSGLAQKGGPAVSHVWVADRAEDIHSTRVGTGAAGLVLGCDMIVAAGKDCLQKMDPSCTHALINATTAPTAAFIKNGNWQVPEGAMEGVLQEAAGASNVDFVQANKLATALMGDAIATNMFMLGYAYQKGWLPVSADALMKAIELNAVSVPFNQKSFNWGRFAAQDLAAVERAAAPAQVVSIVPKAQGAMSLDEFVARRIQMLSDYQDARYARQYGDFVAMLRAEESRRGLGETLSQAVAKYLYKLMAYKDEYEVARLYAAPEFKAKLDAQFEPGYSLQFHLAPPLLARKNIKGELIKKPYGAWMMRAFSMLAKMKGLRGTAFDIFGYTDERRMERAMIVEYRARLQTLLPNLSERNLASALAIAVAPEEIRGYGHVKEANVAKVNAHVASLLAKFQADASATGQVLELKRVA